MIVNSIQDSTKVSSGVTSTSMGAIFDGRAFSLILDKLYTNPHAAVIRELSANALDSHIKCGNTAPFHIQLPTSFDTKFIIRDFGTGLTSDEMQKYLNVIFSSSKFTENESIGGFGLGSKSPFALVDSYNVICYKDNVKSTGLWFRKECGTPDLILVNEEYTEEPNGVEFHVTLDLTDVPKFNKEIKLQLINFPLQPLFFTDINDLSTVYPAPYNCSKLYSYKNLHVLEDPVSNNYFYVSMGGVLYPIPRSFLISLNPEYVYNLKDYSSNCFVVVDMPIGSLTIPMNRESIEDTTKNKKIFEDFCKPLVDEAFADKYKVFEDFLSQTTVKDTDFLKAAASVRDLPTVYKDISTVFENLSLKYPLLKKEKYFSFSYNYFSLRNLLNRFSHQFKEFDNLFFKSSRYNAHFSDHSSFLSKSLYLIVDESQTSLAKIKYSYSNTDYDFIYTIRVEPELVSAFQDTLQFILDVFNTNSLIIRTSTLPKVPRVKKAPPVKVVSSLPTVSVNPPVILGVKIEPCLHGSGLPLRASTDSVFTKRAYTNFKPLNKLTDSSGNFIPLSETYFKSSEVYVLHNPELTFNSHADPTLFYYLLGVTSIVYATDSKYQDVLKVLLKTGAVVYETSEISKTIKDLKQLTCTPDIFYHLFEYSKKFSRMYNYAYQHPLIINYLIKYNTTQVVVSEDTDLALRSFKGNLTYLLSIYFNFESLNRNYSLKNYIFENKIKSFYLASHLFEADLSFMQKESFTLEQMEDLIIDTDIARHAFKDVYNFLSNEGKQKLELKLNIKMEHG